MKPTLCFVLTLTLGASSARAADHPNVLSLLTDDQRADTIAALGNEHIKTPRLDWLTESGTVFSRHYDMGGWHGAICVALRAMLLIGRGLYHVKEDMAGATTWPEQFQRAGYTTFITGKWHNQRLALVRSFTHGRAVFLGGMGDSYELPLVEIGLDEATPLLTADPSGALLAIDLLPDGSSICGSCRPRLDGEAVAVDAAPWLAGNEAIRPRGSRRTALRLDWHPPKPRKTRHAKPRAEHYRLSEVGGRFRWCGGQAVGKAVRGLP